MCLPEHTQGRTSIITPTAGVGVREDGVWDVERTAKGQ